MIDIFFKVQTVSENVSTVHEYCKIQCVGKLFLLFLNQFIQVLNPNLEFGFNCYHLYLISCVGSDPWNGDGVITDVLFNIYYYILAWKNNTFKHSKLCGCIDECTCPSLECCDCKLDLLTGWAIDGCNLSVPFLGQIVVKNCTVKLIVLPDLRAKTVTIAHPVNHPYLQHCMIYNVY